MDFGTFQVPKVTKGALASHECIAALILQANPYHGISRHITAYPSFYIVTQAGLAAMKFPVDVLMARDLISGKGLNAV